jgi:hypothetical protein
MLLKANRIDAGVLAMWQGLPAQQYENMINSRFESKILKAGVVWSDASCNRSSARPLIRSACTARRARPLIAPST